jgi:hypothetical protein
MTSSAAAGFPVVEFFIVPVRVWAEAREVRRMATANAACTNVNAERLENAFRGLNLLYGEKGSFDCAETSLRDVSTPLRMTVRFIFNF